MKIENLTSLLAKTEKELSTLGKSLLNKAAGASHTLGKVIFALSKAPQAQGVSLQKHITATLGASRADIPAASWAIAACCAFIGDTEDKFGETDIDATPVRWLAVVSAIMSAIAGKVEDEKAPISEAEAFGYRKAVADIVRERPANGYELLQSLRDKLKGKASKGDKDAKDGKGDKDGEGEKPQGVYLDDMEPSEAALVALKAAAKYIPQVNEPHPLATIASLAGDIVALVAALQSKYPAAVSSAEILPENPVGTVAPVVALVQAAARKAAKAQAKAAAMAGKVNVGAAFEAAVA